MVAPVSLCMIVRNEGPRILKCLNSIRPHVAEICILDTGSDDGTPELARTVADRVEVWTGCNEGGTAAGRIESFSAARERSFAMASQPWTLWIDGDDTVRGGEHIEEICRQHDQAGSGPLMVMLPYEYSHDHLGNVTCLHHRERLMRGRETAKWFGPVHEVLIPKVPTAMVTDARVVMVHGREGKVSESGRNLRILQKWFDEHGEEDVRLLYYLGLEYGNVGDLANSIRFHMLYSAKSGWDDEKCLSQLELSKHHLTMGNFDEATRWAMSAHVTAETWREPWFALGRIFYSKAMAGGATAARDWARAANFFRRGLQMPPTQTPLFINPMEGRYDVHRYFNVALNNIGAVEEALASCEAGLAAVNGGDANLQHNRNRYVTGLSLRAIGQELEKLKAVGSLSAEQEHVVRNVLSGKFSKREEKKPEAATAPVAQMAAPDKLDIILFTGGAWEQWNPETLARGGMGGSETMAWELMRRLRKLGHRVRVYGDCTPEMEGVFEGVEWIDHRKFVTPDGKSPSCDVLISSRIPELVDYPVAAKLKLAWVHDVHLGVGLTHKRALKFDRFLCLSNWHKQFFLQHYPFVHESQVVVTRNGIDLTRYEGNETRDPHRMIYSSSPDRGLQTVLQCLPEIRKRVPDASLHIFYGFDNWEKHPDPGQQNLAKAIRGMIKAYEPFGAVYRGRVSGQELAREQMKSGVWSYSTWFSETSCLSAMEAQAAGLLMVTSPIAALNETAGDRAAMIGYGARGGNVDWLTPEYSTAFTDAVVEAMDLSPTREIVRDRNRSYALEHFGLDLLAQDWDAMFTRLLAEVDQNPMPAYRAVGT